MKKTISIYFLIFLLFSQACEKEIPYTGPVLPSKMVINAAFSPDSSWKVRVNRTMGITDSTELNVSGAKVRITSLHSGQEHILIEEETGSYVSQDSLPALLQSYSIEIDHPDFPTVRAVDTIPAIPMVQVMDTSFGIVQINSFADLPALQVQLEFEAQAKADYYVIEAFYQREDNGGERIIFLEQLYERDPWISNDEIGPSETIYDRLFLSGQSWGQEKIQVSFAVLGAIPESDRDLILRISSLSHAYYQYQWSFVKYALSYNWTIYPQSHEVFSNVNGGLGIFGAYAAKEIVLGL